MTIKKWYKQDKKKLYLAVAISLALIISGGTFAYTYVNTIATVGVLPPTADVATFNLVGISGGSYTLSITGGTYQLLSRETSEWAAGWTVTPEFYCEATQR